jgi:hypothetical protein
LPYVEVMIPDLPAACRAEESDDRQPADHVMAIDR